MKKINLFLLLSLFASAILISSCKKDKEEPVATTPLMPAAEAKTELRKSGEMITSMATTFENGNAGKAILDFMGAAKFSFCRKDSMWFDNMFNKLGEVINFKAIENDLEINNKFNFANYTGKYSWNHVTKIWDKTPSNSIILEFPANKNATTNKASVNFLNYTHKDYTIDSKTIWVPKSFYIDLKLNNSIIASLHLKDLSFRVNGSELFPISINYETFIDPLRQRLIYAERSSTNYVVDFSVSIGSTTSFGYTASLITKKVLSNVSVPSDLVSVSGSTYFNAVKFVYAINLAKVVAYGDSNPSENQINQDFDIKLYYSGKYVGYLLLENKKVYLVYNDNSKELLEVVFKGFIDEMGKIITIETLPAKSKKLLENKKVKGFISFVQKTSLIIANAK